MADYEACFRTSAFAVRDESAFTAWIETISNLDFIDRNEGDGRTCFEVGAYTGIPDCRDIDGELVKFDFIDELATHLAEGAQAVVTEIGHEKLRYLVGVAIAVDHTGKRVCLDLDNATTALTVPSAA